jgi:hypothetical protein
MRQWIRGGVGLVGLLVAGSGWAAGINAHAKLMYLSLTSESESNNVKTEATQSHQLIGGGACYFIEGSWCIGINLMQYVQESEYENSSLFGASGSSEEKWTATGASLSYIAKPWFANAVYYFSAERESGANTYETNLAWMLEGGYAIDARSVSLGPVLSYMSFHYDEVKTPSGREDLDEEPVDSLIVPSFAVWLNF